MAGYLDLVKTEHLIKAAKNDSYGFRAKFPKLIKLLIDAACGEGASSRIPVDDVTSDPGYDGIVSNSARSSFVPEGLSVWEFGTDENVKNKIKKDYDKRTNNPLGINKKEVTICLCTPRKWPERTESMEEWKDGRNDWKDIKIIDATIIADWLNKTPSVCAWFLEQFTDENSLKISTLDSAWDELRNRTNPILDESFFDFGNEIVLEIEKGKAISLCAENSIDAFGYTLRYLLKSQKKNAVIARDLKTLEKVQDVASEQIIVCNFKTASVMAKNDNCVILCDSLLNKTTRSLKLPKRDFGITNNALVKSGIDASRASYICRATHLKTEAIMRKIKSNAYEESYGWRCAGQYDDILKAMLCVQKCISEVDKEALSRISALDKKELENKIDSLAMIDDSPILKEGKSFVLATPEEVACAYIEGCESIFIIRTKELFLEILDSINNKEKWMGHDYYKCDTLLSSLATLFVYMSAYIDQSETYKMNEMIGEVLNHDAILGNKMVQEKVLARFCEASPEYLIGFLERRTDKIIDGTISKEAFMASIELLLESDCTERACLLLEKIYFLNKDEELLKRLCMALHPLKGHICLSAEKKRKIITKIIQDHDKEALILLKQLFDTSGYFLADRIIRKNRTKEESSITYAEFYNYYESAIEAAIEASSSEKQFELAKIILGNLNCFGLDFLARIKSCFEYKKFTYAQLAEIQLKLVEQKSFATRHNDKLASVMGGWLKEAAYDSVLDNLWLFGSYYHCVNYYFDENMSFKEKETEIEKLRHAFLDNMRKEKPDEYVSIIAGIIKDEYFWGDYVARNDSGDISNWISSLEELGKTTALAGALDATRKEEKGKLLKNLTHESKIQVVERMQNSDICEFLTQEEKETFWKTKEMREYTEDGYQNILKHNPEGLLSYLFTNKDASREQAVEILEAISKLPSRSDNESRRLLDDDYIYGQIFGRFVKVLDDDLDKIAFNLFISGRIKYSVLQVNRYVFGDIERIKEVIEKRDQYIYNDLFGLRIPSELCKEEEKLKSIWSYIEGIDRRDDIFASIVINTIYLEDDRDNKRKLLEVVERQASQEVFNKLNIDLDMKITNGYFYNMSRINNDMDELLAICDGLPKIQKTIKNAIKNNAMLEQKFREMHKEEELKQDRMSI